MGGWCGHLSNYMGHWCLKKSDYMGGGVLSENLLLMFDRYIKSNVNIKQNKVVFHVYKLLLHVKLHCSMQSVKHHDNLRKFSKCSIYN